MNFVQYAGAIILVLALLFLLLGVLQRRGLAHFQLPIGVRTGEKRMEVLERLPLTPQHSLHLVRVHGEVLLVGVSPSGCALLREDAPAAIRGTVRV